MLVVGWWLLLITAYHIVPMLFSALSWRELLPSATRPDVVSVTWIRWIRESINSLLPVANIGGDIASARLAHLRGVPGPQAAASMVVDTTVGVVTQMAFVIAGVVLLVLRPTGGAAFEVVAGVLIGVGALVAAVAAFVLFQHKNMFARFAKLARRLVPEQGKLISQEAHRRSTTPSCRPIAGAPPSGGRTCCALSDGLQARARSGW